MITTADISTASWIAIVGLVIAVVGALIGMPIAGQLLADNDDALVSGLTWGAIVGVVVGGITVGVLCGRASLSANRQRFAVAAAPGTLISVPLLIVILISHDWAALWWVVLFIAASGLTAAPAASMAYRKDPTAP